MAFLYILLSEKDRKLYLGVTEDVRKRLRQHNEGRVRSTKARVPFVLLQSVRFPTMRQARYHEWKMKQSAHFRYQFLQKYHLNLGAW